MNKEFKEFMEYGRKRHGKILGTIKAFLLFDVYLSVKRNLAREKFGKGGNYGRDD